MGGYLLRAVKKCYPAKDFSAYTSEETESTFINNLSRGSLMQLKEWYFNELKNLNKIEDQFNGDEFNYEPQYLARLKAKCSNISIDPDLIT